MSLTCGKLQPSGPQRACKWVHIPEGVYQALENTIGTLGGNIRIVETRSVSFCNESGLFFAELIPMASSVRVLLPMSYDEVDDPGGIAADANRWMWIPNAVHDQCGIVVDVSVQDQIDLVLRMVAQVLSRIRELNSFR